MSGVGRCDASITVVEGRFIVVAEEVSRRVVAGALYTRFIVAV